MMIRCSNLIVVYNDKERERDRDRDRERERGGDAGERRSRELLLLDQLKKRGKRPNEFTVNLVQIELGKLQMLRKKRRKKKKRKKKNRVE